MQSQQHCSIVSRGYLDQQSWKTDEVFYLFILKVRHSGIVWRLLYCYTVELETKLCEVFTIMEGPYLGSLHVEIGY